MLTRSNCDAVMPSFALSFGRGDYCKKHEMQPRNHEDTKKSHFVSCFRVFVAAPLMIVLLACVASAEVVKIDIQRRDDAGTHERLIGRVHFAVDPMLPANRGIADLDQVPTNAKGLVEFSADVLLI